MRNFIFLALLVSTFAFAGNTNKDTPTATITFKKISTPSNPASGYLKCYPKSDDLLYCKTSGGTETAVGVEGSTYTGVKTFSNTTQSTSSTTGAVIVSGGIGVAKAVNVAGRVTVGSEFATARQDVATSASITAMTLTSANVNFTGSTATALHGIAGNGYDGQRLTLYNGSSAIVTVKNQSGSATAVDRIKSPTGADVDLAAGYALELIYDTGQTRWVFAQSYAASYTPPAYLVSARTEVASATSITAMSSATSYVRLTGNTATTLKGITAGVNGQRLVLAVPQGTLFTLSKEDAGASAANRIIYINGLDPNYNHALGFVFEFIYDTGALSGVGRWQLTHVYQGVTPPDPG